MIRVLQMVAPATSSSDGRRGVNGTEILPLTALPYFDTGCVDITVSYSPEGRLWDKFVETGCTLEPFWVRSKLQLSAVRRIQAIIQKYSIQLIHTQGSYPLDLFATLAAKREHIPIIITRHVMINDLKVSAWRRCIYELVDRYTLAKADKIIAVSKVGADYLASCGLRSQKISLVYNGIDLRRFKPRNSADCTRLGIPNEAVVVGACAQLTPPKGWYDFLTVVHRLRQMFPSLRALIIGDGPLRSELQARAAELGMRDVVHFIGHTDDVSGALSCLDLFLFLSHREGLSVAIIEAMASGIPCVATEAGGTREQIEDGVNGYVVRIGDIDQAVDRARQILNEPAKLQAMGQASRAICEKHFELTRMAREYQDIYESVSPPR